MGLLILGLVVIVIIIILFGIPLSKGVQNEFEDQDRKERYLNKITEDDEDK